MNPSNPGLGSMWRTSWKSGCTCWTSPSIRFSSDHKHGVAWRTFFPHEGNGGSVGTGGWINVDSGVLNPELLTKDYGEKAGRVWAKSRLRDKVDAVIIHEFSEAEAGTHEAALAAGLRTERPISSGARRILRAMEEGWRGRG